MPVLYMPDGGLDEDFLHIAGLVQVLVSNGGMRPHLLVGIPNTQRRRDLTPPTNSPEDRTIAPVVGESAAYRRFVRDEVMPAVRARYRTTGESAIVGESLAGLFVVETLMVEPDLFQTYIAIDPSLWWNDETLLKSAGLGTAPKSRETAKRKVFLASSNDPETAALVSRCAAALERMPDRFAVCYVPFSAESHATIFHPAALAAFREMLSQSPRSP